MNIAVRVMALICIFLPSCVQPHGARSGAVPEQNENASVAGSELKLAGDEDRLTIQYVRGTSARHGPRVVDLLIAHSDNLSFVSAQPGPAATAANKMVIVQKASRTKLRVLLFSGGNTNELDSGLLTTLRMQRTDERPARAEILLERPLFAPAAALEGLAMSDPVVF